MPAGTSRRPEAAVVERTNVVRVVPGVYQLLIRLRRRTVLNIGALGSMTFSPGWYVYTGSARSGLHQRVRRHLRRDNRKHWHIDHLLPAADRVEAFGTTDRNVFECELHRSTSAGKRTMPHFGASDCRCGSHLTYFRCRPTLQLGPMPLESAE